VHQLAVAREGPNGAVKVGHGATIRSGPRYQDDQVRAEEW
jgi:hypothetical protein